MASSLYLSDFHYRFVELVSLLASGADIRIHDAIAYTSLSRRLYSNHFKTAQLGNPAEEYVGRYLNALYNAVAYDYDSSATRA
jgi:hypothetical protein